MSIIVVYDSMTGKSKEFAKHLDYTSYSIKEYKHSPGDKIFLLTRSFAIGETSKDSEVFLEQYSGSVIGLAVSGNRNWGINYGAGGVKLSEKYGIPLVLKYEASGFPEDRIFVNNWLKEKDNEQKST